MGEKGTEISHEVNIYIISRAVAGIFAWGWVSDPPPHPSLPLPSLLPLVPSPRLSRIQVGLGSAVPGRSPSRKRILTHLRLSKRLHVVATSFSRLQGK